MENIINKINEIYFAAPPAFRFAYFAWVAFFLIYYFAKLYEKYNINLERSKKKTNFNLVFPILLAFAFFSNHIALYNNVQAYISRDSSWLGALNVCGFIILIAGFFIVLHARAVLNGYWGPHIYEYTDQNSRKLVVENIYSTIRHPIYCGQIIMAFGTAFLSNNWWIFGFPVALGLVNMLRAKNEDKYLELEFKREFLDYRNKVESWIPGFF